MSSKLVTILDFDGCAVYVDDWFAGYVRPRELTVFRLNKLVPDDDLLSPIVYEYVDAQLMYGVGDDQRSDEASKVPFPTLTEQRVWIAEQMAKRGEP